MRTRTWLLKNNISIPDNTSSHSNTLKLLRILILKKENNPPIKLLKNNPPIRILNNNPRTSILRNNPRNSEE